MATTAYRNFNLYIEHNMGEIPIGYIVRSTNSIIVALLGSVFTLGINSPQEIDTSSISGISDVSYLKVVEETTHYTKFNLRVYSTASSASTFANSNTKIAPIFASILENT